VVVVADLGKLFNEADLRAEIILDEKYGLCPQIKPPQTGRRYPSLPYWLARQRQHREMLGEELRLLYVATTRARDRLILSGSVTRSRFETLSSLNGAPTAEDLLAARSYADWLALWCSTRPDGARLGEGAATQGDTGSLRWAIHDDAKLISGGAETAPPDSSGGTLLTADPAEWQALERRLAWQYPFSAATRQPAKTSVSALRRQAAEAGDDEAVPAFQDRGSSEDTRFTFHVSRFTPPAPRLSAADIGSAHHVFLQLVSLDRVGSVAELREEAQRLRREHALADEAAVQLDFEALAAFWASDIGRKILAQARFVQRELAFTARFSAAELAALNGKAADPVLEEEFIVVQGVADLAVLRPEEIWLLDFKTDRLGAADLAEKVKLYEPQLKLYSRALSQIYRRPVTACWLYFLAAGKEAAVG
jgi:ATP-dependent helicase/nuclease subunit A